MYIPTVNSDRLLKTASPICSVTSLLNNAVSNIVTKKGHLHSSNLVKVIARIKIELFFSILLLFVIPLLCVMVIMVLFTLVTVVPFDMNTPLFLCKIILGFNGVIITIKAGWWFLNNRLCNCIYLIVLAEILFKFYKTYLSTEFINSDNYRDEMLIIYLEQATKEWSYYDKAGEL